MAAAHHDIVDPQDAIILQAEVEEDELVLAVEEDDNSQEGEEEEENENEEAGDDEIGERQRQPQERQPPPPQQEALNGIPVVDGIPYVMSSTDPRRMQLTTFESWCAHRIKDAIESSPDIDNLCDFWYGQFAIICQDNVEDAVHRAQVLQVFRQEYKILDSHQQQGCRAITHFLELAPQVILFFAFSESDGAYVLVDKPSAMQITDFNTPAKADAFFVACWYIGHCCFPDFAAIRLGLINVCECEGMDWSKKMNFKLITRLFSQLWSAYPFTGTFQHYHTGVIFNTMGTIFKKFLPTELREKFVFGLVGRSRLDSICMVPTPEIATQRLQQEMFTSLRLRYENEKKFSLGPRPREGQRH